MFERGWSLNKIERSEFAAPQNKRRWVCYQPLFERELTIAWAALIAAMG
jgi:hypothetical protein